MSGVVSTYRAEGRCLKISNNRHCTRASAGIWPDEVFAIAR